MKHALVLKHAPFEGPGRLAAVLETRGYTLEIRELNLGQAVPRRIDAGDVLIVMGGPMGVADRHGREYPFLEPELELLRRCIDDGAPVLGICLGAQLLAAAAGAVVAPMVDDQGIRRYEVGWAPLQFHHLDETDPVLRGLPNEAPLLHWHGDAFELPAGARRLASTPTCPCQAFLLNERLFGLQFHPEVAAADIEIFVREDLDIAERAAGPDASARIREDTQRFIDGGQRVGDRLLTNILGVMEGP